jgi:hypothetical protein
MDVKSGSVLRALLVERARACIGVAVYRRSAVVEDAPQVFNCFRFTQWLWSPVGIQLPDHQLSDPQLVPVSLDTVDSADLVFVPRMNYNREEDDFGHVGVATDVSTVIHATKWRNSVVEEPLHVFISRGVLGVRRVPEEYYCRR